MDRFNGIEDMNMMRFQIKAKITNSENYIIGTGVKSEVKKCFLWHNNKWVEVSPETISEFAGLHKKTKSYLYVGDMVKFKVSKKKDINGWRIGKIVRIGYKLEIWSK